MIHGFDLRNTAVQPPALDTRAEASTPGALSALTTRQRAVFETIDRYYDSTGEPCSASYLSRRLRVHRSTITEHLVALHRKGWLRSPHSPATPR